MARLNPITPGNAPIEQPDRRMFLGTDTNVVAKQPDPIQDSAFYQLAQGLSKIQPDIAQYVQQQAKSQSEDDLAAGRSAQIKSGLALGEAVRRGVVPPDQSPMFVAGYNEMDGKNTAYQLGESVTGALKSDPVINSQNPADVSKWVTDQVGAGIAKLDPSQTGNPSFMNALTKTLEPYYGKASVMHAQASSANATESMNDAIGVSFKQTLDATLDNQQPGQPTDVAGLAAKLHAITTLPAFVGVQPKVTQDLMAQAVANKATEMRDPSILDVLTQDRPNRINPKMPGEMLPGYGNTVQGQALIGQTTNQINSLNVRDDNAATVAQNKADILQVKSTEADLSKILFSGGSLGPAQKAQLDQAAKRDPGVYARMLSLQSAVTNQGEKTATQMSPVDASNFIYKLTSGDVGDAGSRTAFLQSSIANGTFKLPVPEMMKTYEQMDALDKSGIDKMPGVQQALSAVTDMADPNRKNPIFADPSAAPRVKANILSEMQDFTVNNPHATTAEINDHANDTLAKVLKWNDTQYPSTMQLGGAKGPVNDKMGAEPPAAPATTAAPPPRPDQTNATAFPSPTAQDVASIIHAANNPTRLAALRSQFGNGAVDAALLKLKK